MPSGIYPRPQHSFEERFWRRVRIDDGCWEWTGGRIAGGYGVLYGPGHKRMLAHRAAYELTHGVIPGGLSVLHNCDNRICVNPDHLRLGTQRDNMQDVVVRRRHPNYWATYCKKGLHPRTEENLYRFRGGRTCRPCREASIRRLRDRAEVFV